MTPRFDLYEIDGLPIVASSDEQAYYFASAGVRAKVPGDPGIQEEAIEPSVCRDCGRHPARESGYCHYCDPDGVYQRKLQERKAA